jgi:hypothetical protein
VAGGIMPVQEAFCPTDPRAKSGYLLASVTAQARPALVEAPGDWFDNRLTTV